ncbi:hypothetical protein ACLKA6_016057 [Drosophila palustris]
MQFHLVAETVHLAVAISIAICSLCGNDLDLDVAEDDDEQRATQYVRFNGNIRRGFHNDNEANFVESDSECEQTISADASSAAQQSEINNEQRMQRERIVFCLGLAYLVLKIIFWLI